MTTKRLDTFITFAKRTLERGKMIIQQGGTITPLLIIIEPNDEFVSIPIDLPGTAGMRSSHIRRLVERYNGDAYLLVCDGYVRDSNPPHNRLGEVLHVVIDMKDLDGEGYMVVMRYTRDPLVFEPIEVGRGGFIRDIFPKHQGVH